MRTMVCRNSAMPGRLLLRELVLQHREEHRVLPLVVFQVRLPLHALAYVADAFGVRDRTLVEPVDLQLEPVEAELAEHMPLEQPRDLVADLAAAEARVHREPPALDDPVPLAHHPVRGAARRLAVDLGDEPAELLGSARREVDVVPDVVERVAGAAEERADVVATDQVEEKV